MNNNNTLNHFLAFAAAIMLLMLLPAFTQDQGKEKRSSLAVSKDLSQGYGLLYLHAKSEAHAEQVLTFRESQEEIQMIVREISRQSSQLQKTIEQFYSGRLDELPEEVGLPLVEKNLRDQMASEESSQIYYAEKSVADRELLLTQWKNLSYGYHLLTVMTALEPDSSRSKVLEKYAAQWKSLRDQLLDIM
ncbi:MAG: hypothetical protein V4507_15540 [Verrucomicrobiota bacterium]